MTMCYNTTRTVRYLPIDSLLMSLDLYIDVTHRPVLPLLVCCLQLTFNAIAVSLGAHIYTLQLPNTHPRAAVYPAIHTGLNGGGRGEIVRGSRLAAVGSGKTRPVRPGVCDECTPPPPNKERPCCNNDRLTSCGAVCCGVTCSPTSAPTRNPTAKNHCSTTAKATATTSTASANPHHQP